VFISGQVTIDNGTETAAIQLMAARVVGSADARAELGKATCGLQLLLLSRKRSIYSRRPASSLSIGWLSYSCMTAVAALQRLACTLRSPLLPRPSQYCCWQIYTPTHRIPPFFHRCVLNTGNACCFETYPLTVWGPIS